MVLDDALSGEGGGSTMGAPEQRGIPRSEERRNSFHGAPRPGGAGDSSAPGQVVEGPVWDNVISRAEWERLEVGMSVPEAGGVVGGAGEVLQADHLGASITIRWNGTTPGSYATATFADGRLARTAQFRLE